jgi:hypothetical protein
MKKCTRCLCVGLGLLFTAASARATILVADFNDLTAGTLNGKGGGTGWTGNWTGSAGGTVAANDLTSALYSVPQSGTPLHYRSINATGLRQNYRTPAASPTGTIWFSYLAEAEATGDRAGVSINPPTPTPFNDPGTAYAYLIGNTLSYQFGAGTAGTTAAGPVGSANLIVGKVDLNGGAGGADPVTLWLNPDLVANPDITAYTPVYDNASVDWLNSITTVGAVAARADGASSGGGDVDNIRFSDGGGNASQAYTDVTGVSAPEPAGLALLSAAAAVITTRRRRPTR